MEANNSLVIDYMSYGVEKGHYRLFLTIYVGLLLVLQFVTGCPFVVEIISQVEGAASVGTDLWSLRMVAYSAIILMIFPIVYLSSTLYLLFRGHAAAYLMIISFEVVSFIWSWTSAVSTSSLELLPLSLSSFLGVIIILIAFQELVVISGKRERGCRLREGQGISLLCLLFLGLNKIAILYYLSEIITLV